MSNAKINRYKKAKSLSLLLARRFLPHIQNHVILLMALIIEITHQYMNESQSHRHHHQ